MYDDARACQQIVRVKSSRREMNSPSGKFFRFASRNNNRTTEGVEMLSPPLIAQRRTRRSKTISETLRRSTRKQRRPKLDRHFAGAIERYEKCRKLENAVVVHARCITCRCNRINPDVITNTSIYFSESELCKQIHPGVAPMLPVSAASFVPSLFYGNLIDRNGNLRYVA